MDAFERDREVLAGGQDDYWPEEWIEDDPLECDECGHALALHHEPYGCEHEFGDDESTGVARGQCGCTAVMVEVVS